MKVVAITIDEPTLERIDVIARAAAGSTGAGEKRRGRGRGRSRSEVVRLALRQFIESHERRQREDRERRILAAHREQLVREARALIREQAEP